MLLRLFKASFGGAIRGASAPISSLRNRSLFGLRAQYLSSVADGFSKPLSIGTQLTVKNVPIDADAQTIHQFFDDSEILSMYWRHGEEGDEVCECCVNFRSVSDARKAFTKDSEELLGSPISITPRSKRVSNCRTVFLANLSFDATDEDIRNFVEPCGEVKAIFRVKYAGTSNFKGQVFCEFEDGESVDTCMEELHGELLLGRPVRVDYAKRNVTESRPFSNKWSPPTGKPEGCTSLFVGNVSDDADTEDFEELSEKCGAEISKINWLYDRDTNAFKRCGFIHFRDTESVDKFLVNHGQNVKGRRVRLNFPNKP